MLDSKIKKKLNEEVIFSRYKARIVHRIEARVEGEDITCGPYNIEFIYKIN